MKPPALDELIEQILTKVRAGTISAEDGQAAIKRLIEEAGEAATPLGESAGEQRIKSAARQARRMA